MRFLSDFRLNLLSIELLIVSFKQYEFPIEFIQKIGVVVEKIFVENLIFTDFYNFHLSRVGETLPSLLYYSILFAFRGYSGSQLDTATKPLNAKLQEHLDAAKSYNFYCASSLY